MTIRYIIGDSMLNPQEDIQEDIARKVIYLIFSAKAWINRRVDSVSFSDPASITRRVSVDLTIPEIIVDGQRLDGCILLPIAMLQKSDMANLSTQTEHNDTWSLCSFEDTRDISYLMLKWWQQKCEVEITYNEHEWRQAVLDFDPGKETGDDLEWLMAKVDPKSTGEDSRKKAFRALARILARDRILFARVPWPPGGGKGGDVRVFKFTYDRPFRPNSTKEVRELTPSGESTSRRYPTISNTQMVITAANPNYARHYHLEFTVPSDVAIVKAMLYDELTGFALSRLHSNQATRCDLFEEKHHGIRFDALVRAYFLLAPTRRSWTTAVFLTSLFATLILASIGITWWVGFPKINNSSKGVTEETIELAFPVVVAFASLLFAIFIQPEENNFSRFLLNCFRKWILYCITFVAIAITGATVAVMAEHPKSAGAIFTIDAIFASICFGRIWYAWHHFASFPVNENMYATQSVGHILDVVGRPRVIYQPLQLRAGACNNLRARSCLYEQVELDTNTRAKIKETLDDEFPDWKTDVDWWNGAGRYSPDRS